MNLTFYPYTLKLKHKFVLSKQSRITTLNVLNGRERVWMKIINVRITLPEGN